MLKKYPLADQVWTWTLTTGRTCFKRPFQASFSISPSLYINNKLLMIGFEPGYSGVYSDCSLSCSTSTAQQFFFRNGPNPAYFCYFLFFSHDKYSTNTINDKSIDGVLGTRTQGSRMVGAVESTELWRQPNSFSLQSKVFIRHYWASRNFCEKNVFCDQKNFGCI